jgi:hypothetical protein
VVLQGRHICEGDVVTLKTTTATRFSVGRLSRAYRVRIGEEDTITLLVEKMRWHPPDRAWRPTASQLIHIDDVIHACAWKRLSDGVAVQIVSPHPHTVIELDSGEEFLPCAD